MPYLVFDIRFVVQYLIVSHNLCMSDYITKKPMPTKI